MTRPLTILLAGSAALVACSPADPAAKGEHATAQSAPPSTPTDLTGRWRILSIDGQPPASRSDGERAPALVFSAYQGGGTVGCNSFGGLGLLADGQYATHSWGGSAIGCLGKVGEQERVVTELLSNRPRVRFLGEKRVRIDDASHAVELERVGPNDAAPVPAGPKPLAGTNWQIETLDGVRLPPGAVARSLRFTTTNWRGTAACATLHGTWRRAGDRILVGPEIAATEPNCPPALARIDDALADLMASNPRYLVGPNGELLIAGGGHALAGERAR